jgi:hypothetical protein
MCCRVDLRLLHQQQQTLNNLTGGVCVGPKSDMPKLKAKFRFGPGNALISFVAR